jgi:hypothetical protein
MSAHGRSALFALALLREAAATITVSRRCARP